MIVFLAGLYSVLGISTEDGVQLLLDFPLVFDEDSEQDSNFHESGSHARGLPD